MIPLTDANAFVAMLAEDPRLAMLQVADVVSPQIFISGLFESAAVNAMQAIRVQVIREAARTADARHEAEFFFRNAERRQHLFHLSEDRVVAAAWAPTDFLIAGKVLRGQGRQFDSHRGVTFWR